MNLTLLLNCQDWRLDGESSCGKVLKLSCTIHIMCRMPIEIKLIRIVNIYFQI